MVNGPLCANDLNQVALRHQRQVADVVTPFRGMAQRTKKGSLLAFSNRLGGTGRKTDLPHCHIGNDTSNSMECQACHRNVRPQFVRTLRESAAVRFVQTSREATSLLGENGSFCGSDVVVIPDVRRIEAGEIASKVGFRREPVVRVFERWGCHCSREDPVVLSELNRW
jgi:hypothetical protein